MKPRNRPARFAASLAATLMLALFIAAPATAATEIDGVRFADSVTIDDTIVPLRAGRLYRYTIFRVYVGALYAPEDVAPEDVLTAAVPKRLELEYLRAISADDFRKSGNSLLEDQQDAETLAALADRLNTFNAAYRDMEAGDRYALEYRPGHGTRLLQNGTPLVEVPGHDFAEAYFGIWLHPEAPLSRRFRDTLIGQR
ncbi:MULTISPECIES: chalcone isomerase family protein [unclassified Thioalkalivibrio]|uniref:chalcone isomerase family protein n=1 Tax=unclassified Thioalkalivibrio TaxID=2621013 RepID=UPI00037A216F|nr:MULTISPECIES: chalcone isomerase family protein [unclassified Thioalkalivibrio]